VSTDYDECDRLYFEELSRERVLDIYNFDKADGVVISVGGQIPNGLALPLDEAGVKIMGTTAKMIDNAEDRMKFSDMIDEIGVQQPRWRELTSADSALDFAHNVGYPGKKYISCFDSIGSLVYIIHCCSWYFLFRLHFSIGPPVLCTQWCSNERSLVRRAASGLLD
jgi:hypothetical protein